MKSFFAGLVALIVAAPSVALAQEEPEAPVIPVSPPPPPPAPTTATTPTTSAPPEDPPDLALPQPVPPARRRVRLFGALEGGYQFASLYDVAISGASVSAVLGADFGRWTIGGRIEGDPGRTEGGLSTFGFFAGPDAEARFGRLRVGGGIRLGVFSVDRITTSTTLATGTLGCAGRLSVDLIRFDDEGNGAFFLVAKSSADIVSGLIYSVGVGAGVRF